MMVSYAHVISRQRRLTACLPASRCPSIAVYEYDCRRQLSIRFSSGLLIKQQRRSCFEQGFRHQGHEM